MKKIILLLLLFNSIPLFAQQENKALINRKDSIITLTANIRMDHRISGYERPDINSRRMLMLSVFTNDVEGNPYGCAFGAFYDSSSMAMDIKYITHEGNFIKAELIKDAVRIATIYFEKYWIEWEEE